MNCPLLKCNSFLPTFVTPPMNTGPNLPRAQAEPKTFQALSGRGRGIPEFSPTPVYVFGKIALCEKAIHFVLPSAIKPMVHFPRYYLNYLLNFHQVYIITLWMTHTIPLLDVLSTTSECFKMAL